MEEQGHEMDYEVVYECNTDGEAQVIVTYLENNGIDAFTNSSWPHTTFPVTSAGEGEVTVIVSSYDADRAKDLIAEHPGEEEPLA